MTARRKRVLADLISGREVKPEDAFDALSELEHVDAHVIATGNGTVRLRVPVFARYVQDVSIQPQQKEHHAR